MKEAFDWAFDLDEPSVIISRWPCALKKYSEYDKEEFGQLSGVCEVDRENVLDVEYVLILDVQQYILIKK